MFNPHTKFEVFTITCNREMKGNAKCKNSCFEPPFGGLKGNAQGSAVSRWKVHCRLPVSDNLTFLASDLDTVCVEDSGGPKNHLVTYYI